MSHKSPAFRFYASDFLTSRKVMLMTDSQVGKYIKLLCHEWMDGPLPNDTKLLSKLIPCSHEEFLSDWSGISECFIETKSGLVQRRLEEERRKQRDYSTSRSKNSNVRWNAYGEHVESTCNAHALHNENENESENEDENRSENGGEKQQPETVSQHTATCAGSDLFTDTAVDPDEVRSNPNPAPAESHPKPHRATRRSDSMPKPDKPPRERNPLFDALVDVCQLNPATDGARYGKAIKALLALPEPPTPDEIRTKFPPYWSDRCSGTGFSGPPSPEKVASLFSIARAFKGRKQPVKPLPANMIEPDDEYREQIRVASAKRMAENRAKAEAALRARGEWEEGDG